MDRGMTIIHLISIFCSYSFNLPGVFLSLSLSQIVNNRCSLFLPLEYDH